MKSVKVITLFLSLFLFLGLTSAGFAENFPTRSIRVDLIPMLPEEQLIYWPGPSKGHLKPHWG